MADLIGALRARRLELGLTQAQLAARLNVTKGAVARWERSGTAGNSPTLDTLRRWAGALGLQIYAIPKIDGAQFRPHGTMAAARRHYYHHESLCEPCRDAERQRDRLRKHAQRAAR